MKAVVKTVWVLVAIAATSFGAEPSLLETIRRGNLAEVRRALKSGADANTKNEAGVTALMYAVAFQPVDGVRLLLDHGANVNQASNAGVTPLMTAVGDLEKVKLLVERGADVNAKSAKDRTPLALALRLPGGVAVARYLTSNGAKPNPAALTGAIRWNATDLVDQFIQQGVKITPSMLTQAADNPALVRLVLDKAPDAAKFVTELNKMTPLMLASYEGNAKSVRLILERSDGVNAKDERGRTSLMYAAASDRGVPDVIRVLLEKGADRSLRDTRGDTALDFAKARGLPEVIRALGGDPAPPAGSAEESAPGPLRESLLKAVARLDEASPKFFKANGCISCHNQSIPQMAEAALRSAGISHQEKHSKYVLSMWSPRQDEFWQTTCTGGGAIATFSYGLVGLAAEGQPQTEVVDLVTKCVVNLQHSDGHWSIPDTRPPLGSNDAKFTALSIRALKAYPLPGIKDEFSRRIQRARRYLQDSKERDTQSLAFRIVGLRWAGAPDSAIKPLAKSLAALQRADGGWAQHPEMSSDAYATGQALWALREGANWKISDSLYERGANYLRRAQKPDGSWHVRSRALGFQPYRETGFPHGHDQWISSAATGFAVMALAPLAAPQHSAGLH